VSATRMGDAALSNSEDAAEVQLRSCPGAQPVQSGAPSRHEASLQAETLCCRGRVARSRSIDRRSRDGGRVVYRRASVTLTPPISRAIGSSRSERAFQASQSPFTLRQVRLTTSLPTGPANTAANARRTRRVLVPDR